MQRKAYRWIWGAWLVLALPQFLKANEIRIIEARRNIPLTDDEPRFMDFYLNGGRSNGLKKDQVVKVIRKMPIRNAQGNLDLGTLDVPVAELRIIFTDERKAVARLYRLLDREELPLIDQPSVMIGDIVDLKGAFDYKKRASLEFSQFD